MAPAEATDATCDAAGSEAALEVTWLIRACRQKAGGWARQRGGTHDLLGPNNSGRTTLLGSLPGSVQTLEKLDVAGNPVIAPPGEVADQVGTAGQWPIRSAGFSPIHGLEILLTLFYRPH